MVGSLMWAFNDGGLNAMLCADPSLPDDTFVIVIGHMPT
jgi:hypothetical protein